LLRPDDLAALKLRVPDMLMMRSMPVVGEGSIAIARRCDGIVDFPLLDSHREPDHQIGALGVTHDWTISRRLVQLVRTPVILAGGFPGGLPGHLERRSSWQRYNYRYAIMSLRPELVVHKRTMPTGCGVSLGVEDQLVEGVFDSEPRNALA
jgi:hypothetical protein